MYSVFWQNQEALSLRERKINTGKKIADTVEMKKKDIVNQMSIVSLNYVINNYKL